jgi:hypothetical protein
LKLSKTKLAVSSANKPENPFLYNVKSENVLMTGGFRAHGFVGSVTKRSEQGKVRGASLKILSPYLKLEWDVLLKTDPNALPMGQTSLDADGPSGRDLI